MRDTNKTKNSRISSFGFSMRVLLAMATLFFLLPISRAQQDEEQKGIEQGNYNIKQSIEFGGRFTSVTGNFQTYDTFVNLQQGPRLLDFTTEMRSLNHHGTLFDRLYFSNFGYGGDPNNVSRLRVGKNHWYSFDALFRKDENFWDYSIQANPLNPTLTFANGPAGYGGAGANACTACVLQLSPHLFNTRRKLGDYSLLILPDSKIRFRAGYSRNTVEGPVFSSIHEGTEQELFENYKTTINTYRVGVDFRLLPRTNISYDQIWNYYKGDTGITDPFQNPLFVLANAAKGPIPVDLGWSFNAGANQPCGATFSLAGAGLTVPAGTPIVNPTCSAAFSYSNTGRTRTNTPTEQLSLQSNYWKNLDLSARVGYSSGNTNLFGYNETLAGRVSRTNIRNDTFTGPVSGERVAATADFGVTYHLTNDLSFLDSFHFANFHNPVQFLSTECAFFSGNLLTPANVFSTAVALPATCAAPADGNTTAGVIPVHSGSSGPDISLLNVSQFLKQDEKTNLAEIEYNFTPRISGRLGYRYRTRTIADSTFASGTFVFFPNNQNARTPPAPYNTMSCPASQNLAGGTCILVMPGQGASAETDITENTALFGVSARPIDALRMSFDGEIGKADNIFTRISPRETKEFRVRAKYKVTDWLSANGSIYVWLGRNSDIAINNNQHNRAYGFSVDVHKSEKIGLELGYDYNDVFSQILICYISVAAGQNGPGIQACPNVAGLTQQLSTYTNYSHYGFFTITATPTRRLTGRLGANLTGTRGSQLRLDPQALIPNQVTGSLNSKWLHPYGGLDYHIAKGWTGKAYWDYYGYHEDLTPGAVQDTFAGRNFNGNLFTLSLRYAF